MFEPEDDSWLFPKTTPPTPSVPQPVVSIPPPVIPDVVIPEITEHILQLAPQTPEYSEREFVLPSQRLKPNTEPDMRRRIYRKPEEMRPIRMSFRMTKEEADDFYQFARSYKTTMSYLIRAALEELYPSIFGGSNRNIRKPRKKQRKIPKKTHIMQSLANGTTTILSVDTKEDLTE